MKITDVRIRLIRHKRRLKAVASITLDDALILNDIMVIQAQERLCIEFPKNPYVRDKNRIEHIAVPMSMEVRNEFEERILNKYECAALLVKEVS